jgi:hypothetical protein
MKYALLVYDAPGSWHDVPTELRHALHGQYQDVADSPGVIDHFRLRPARTTTTVRVEDGQIAKTEGPLDTRENLRAIYVVDGDDHDSVLELAARIPAARRGGAVEVWALMEPHR